MSLTTRTDWVAYVQLQTTVCNVVYVYLKTRYLQAKTDCHQLLGGSCSLPSGYPETDCPITRIGPDLLGGHCNAVCGRN